MSSIVRLCVVWNSPSPRGGTTDVTMIWDQSGTDGEHAEWYRTHDPVLKLGRVMLAKGAATRDDIEAMDREAMATMAEAKAFAGLVPIPGKARTI